MYIKKGIEYTIIKHLTESHENVYESILIEINHATKEECSNRNNLQASFPC